MLLFGHFSANFWFSWNVYFRDTKNHEPHILRCVSCLAPCCNLRRLPWVWNFTMVVSYRRSKSRVEVRQYLRIARHFIIHIHAFQVSESVGEALASFVRNYFKPMKDNKGYFTKCSSELDNALYKNASVSKWVVDNDLYAFLFNCTLQPHH